MSVNVHNWSATQRKYMEWLATPSDYRTPLTQKALAVELGLNEKTLCRWKYLPGFIAEVNKIVDEHLADDFGAVVAALKREAKRGNFPHQKLYFEMINKYIPRQEITGKDGGPIGIELVEVIR